MNPTARWLRWYLAHSPLRAGKSHLFRWFRPALLAGGPVDCLYDDDVAMRLELDDWVQRQIFLYGVYRVEERHRDFMLSRVRSGGTVLDVGAHVGYYSLLFAKRLGPRGRVVAFEPAPSTHARLAGNVALNRFDNIELVQAAASDGAGQATLHVAPGSNTGGSSLHLDGGTGIAVTVPTVALDAYLDEAGIDAVSLVKIDVEGHEPRVLDGLSRTLSRPPGEAPEIFVEVNAGTLAAAGATSESVFGRLQGAGYTAHRILDGRTCQAQARPFADSLVYFRKGAAAGPAASASPASASPAPSATGAPCGVAR